MSVVTKVRILGREYTLKGNVDSDYMNNIALKVDERVEEIRKLFPAGDELQLVILTTLNLIDEIEQLKKNPPVNSISESDADISLKTDRLITMLEKGIIGDSF